MWWEGRHHAGGRDRLLPDVRHSDDGDASGYVGNDGDHRDDDGWGDSEKDASVLRLLPAEAGAEGWRMEEADTEVLPRLQDIQPPARETPIRRPPWV
jgi:hypothetical protein